jgi:hypothetical protein
MRRLIVSTLLQYVNKKAAADPVRWYKIKYNLTLLNY